jgi:hypothetical protein
MTRKVLVVGSGIWATRLVNVLSKKTDFSVSQISAREFVSDTSASKRKLGVDLGISATTPELQEKVAPKLMLDSKHLWLEKPVATTNESAVQLIKNLEEFEPGYSLFNFSWSFSAIWKRFLELNRKFEDVEIIEIVRKASNHSHEYISAVEDYGSHDLALLKAWILRDENRKANLIGETLSENEFRLTSANGLIHWRIDFGFSYRSMIWKIHWKNGEKTCIDFYNRKLRHQEVEIESENFDTIDSFLETLFGREKNVMQMNHKIALWTKEMSSRLMK